jgi:hypothetical protein
MAAPKPTILEALPGVDLDNGGGLRAGLELRIGIARQQLRLVAGGDPRLHRLRMCRAARTAAAQALQAVGRGI